jgi:hypothetical protein
MSLPPDGVLTYTGRCVICGDRDPLRAARRQIAQFANGEAGIKLREFATIRFKVACDGGETTERLIPVDISDVDVDESDVERLAAAVVDAMVTHAALWHCGA